MAAFKEKHATKTVSPFGKSSRTFEEIAKQQGVGPVEDPNELVGGWPGDVDDGFEEAVLAWRQQRLSAQG
jgi:hypothetical protein